MKTVEQYMAEKSKKFGFLESDNTDIKAKADYDNEVVTFVSKKKNKRRFNKKRNMDAGIAATNNIMSLDNN